MATFKSLSQSTAVSEGSNIAYQEMISHDLSGLGVSFRDSVILERQ